MQVRHEFCAYMYGRQLTRTATMPDVTGSYDGASGWVAVNIVQQGSEVSGCYEHQSGRFTGVVDGRRMLLDVVEVDAGGGGTTRWRSVFGVSSDGRRIVGLMRGTEDYQQKGYAPYYGADRRSRRPEACD